LQHFSGQKVAKTLKGSGFYDRHLQICFLATMTELLPHCKIQIAKFKFQTACKPLHSPLKSDPYRPLLQSVPTGIVLKPCQTLIARKGSGRNGVAKASCYQFYFRKIDTVP